MVHDTHTRQLSNDGHTMLRSGIEFIYIQSDGTVEVYSVNWIQSCSNNKSIARGSLWEVQNLRGL